MNCLLCDKVAMQKKSIDENLEGYVCSKCEGVWIQAKAYWKWIKSHGHILLEKPESETLDLEVLETKEIKICLDCGHFLTKRKVGHGISFHIDRCACCGGVWLDKNEWEILKSRNLHDEIHFIFSREWQDEILHQEQYTAYSKQIEDRLGTESFQKVIEFKDWLAENPNDTVILAYLKNEISGKS